MLLRLVQSPPNPHPQKASRFFHPGGLKSLLLCSSSGGKPYFRHSSTATATETVIPTMGEQCRALRIRIPATCRWQVATLPMGGSSVPNSNYFRLSSTATATETVIPTMGLLPAPRKPIISTSNPPVGGFVPAARGLFEQEARLFVKQEARRTKAVCCAFLLDFSGTTPLTRADTSTSANWQEFVI